MQDLAQAHDFVIYAWWLALGFALIMYVMLDGADLGAGVFSLFVRDPHERSAIMGSMEGIWDANETWLVVAGGVLFGTFPLVYGSAFHYLMLPLLIVLCGIMMRAISLELRHHSRRSEWFWDGLFGVSSLMTLFFAGMALGAALKGFPLTTGEVPTYVGGLFRFISPFSIWTGVCGVVGASLAGSLFIRARFEHTETIRHDAARWVGGAFYLTLLAAIVTIVWSAVIFPWARQKWLGDHFWVWFLVACAVVIATVQMRRAALRERDFAAILWLNAAIALMGLAMMATMFPWIVPGTWTVYSGASPSSSLFVFTLTMGGFLPVMVAYNWYQIWVFRSRITKHKAYGH